MKKDNKFILLKESYTSYIFWSLFVIAVLFYLTLHRINTMCGDIDYLLSQKNQLENETEQNTLEIIGIQNFLQTHSAMQDNKQSSEAFSKKLEKLLQQYVFTDDCLTVHQSDGEATFTIEDTTDYFLLQSFLLDLCKLHTCVQKIYMNAKGENVHFVIAIKKIEEG